MEKENKEILYGRLLWTECAGRRISMARPARVLDITEIPTGCGRETDE